MKYGNMLNTPKSNINNEDVCSIVSDGNGMIMGISNRFSEVCGYDLTEVIGKPHSMFFDTEFETIIEEMSQTVLNGHLWEGYVKKITKYGESIWVHLTAHPIGENGDFLSICRMVLDEEIAELTSNYTFKGTVDGKYLDD